MSYKKDRQAKKMTQVHDLIREEFKHSKSETSAILLGILYGMTEKKIDTILFSTQLIVRDIKK